LTTASSGSGVNGFTIQPVAPAARASCFFSCCDSVHAQHLAALGRLGRLDAGVEPDDL
jgi:hypothetical protein